MKKILIVITILFLSNQVFASNKKVSIKKLTIGGLGWVSAYMFHEFGHRISADMLGVKTKWGKLTKLHCYHYPNNKRETRIISTSGFAFDVIGNEVMLNTKLSNTPFGYAWVASNIYCHLRANTSDFKTMESAGVNSSNVRIGLFVYGLFNIYRLHSKKEFPFYITVDNKNIGVSVKLNF